MPKLLIRTPDDEERVHELTDEVVLGREEGVTLQVNDSKVSRKHCRFAPQIGAWIVEDLGSSNGTKVNGVTQKKHTLRNGDKITVGRTVVIFEAEAPKRFQAPTPKSARERLGQKSKRRHG